MTPFAQRVADAVYRNTPHLYWFPCLAAQQGAKEHDVRAVALIVIMRGGLQLIQGACSRCHRSAETLAPRKVA